MRAEERHPTRKTRRPTRPLALAAALLAVGVTGACQGNEIENVLARVPWFTNMRHQPSVGALEERPRTPPEGAVAVDAGLPLMATPAEYDAVTNPVAADEASLARGEELYVIFCLVCHGPEGQGGGYIEGPFPAGLIPQLTAESAVGRSDGYIFGMMAAGRGLMPNYRRIPEGDRWHLVNYVRQLQAEGEQ